MPTHHLPTFSDWGLNIYAGTFEVLLEWLRSELSRDSREVFDQLTTEPASGQVPADANFPSKPLVVMTPNPEIVMQSRENPQLLSALQSADVLIPDGTGLVWAAKLQGKRRKQSATHQSTSTSTIQERITGVDLVSALLSEPKVAQMKILVIGGRGLGVDSARSKSSTADASSETDSPQDGSKASVSGHSDSTQVSKTRSSTQSESPTSKLSQLAPLIISSELAQAYWLEGYCNVALPTETEESTVLSVLSTLQPDTVFVAFGAPYQEIWIAEHFDFLKKNQVRLVMSVGGSFDILTGKLKRAPQWMQTMGLEWLARLVQEPQRIGRQMRWMSFMWSELC